MHTIFIDCSVRVETLECVILLNPLQRNSCLKGQKLNQVNIENAKPLYARNDLEMTLKTHAFCPLNNSQADSVRV